MFMCAPSCFEAAMYIQNRSESGWKLKLDVATIVKHVEPRDEVHFIRCDICEIGPILGPF